MLLACSRFDDAFLLLKQDITKLLPYATYTRYPDDYFDIDYTEAQQAIEHAAKILRFVKAKINLKNHPAGQEEIF